MRGRSHRDVAAGRTGPPAAARRQGLHRCPGKHRALRKALPPGAGPCVQGQNTRPGCRRFCPSPPPALPPHRVCALTACPGSTGAAATNGAFYGCPHCDTAPGLSQAPERITDPPRPPSPAQLRELIMALGTQRPKRQKVQTHHSGTWEPQSFPLQSRHKRPPTQPLSNIHLGDRTPIRSVYRCRLLLIIAGRCSLLLTIIFITLDAACHTG